jgi:crotonobetainyl-CoA:carnitine CoA-transferase CaiB-like acyl-CoA transferase
MAIGVGNDEQFRRLSEGLGVPELADDLRFSTNPFRVENRAELISILQERLSKNTTAMWLDKISAAGVPAGRINNVKEVFSDPQVLSRNMLMHIVDTAGASMPLVGPVAKFSAAPSTIRSAPPGLGEHTDEVLREQLRISKEDIADYRRRGII